MPEKGWRSKGDKGIRSSPRQRGKTCGRPFSAPRKARDTRAETTTLTEPKERQDSEVRVLTETEIGKALNNWCSAKTIERFLKSHPDYLTYSQNVRPLLSEGNRLKQVAFSKHVQNRWGLGEGKKILWTIRYFAIPMIITLSYAPMLSLI